MEGWLFETFGGGALRRRCNHTLSLRLPYSAERNAECFLLPLFGAGEAGIKAAGGHGADSLLQQ